MNKEKEIENALKFHEEHLFFNPIVEHDLNKVMKLRGVMKVSEVRKLLQEGKAQTIKDVKEKIEDWWVNTMQNSRSSTRLQEIFSSIDNLGVEE